MVENPDQPSQPILGAQSSKLESVSRGEVMVSSPLFDVDLVRCHKTVCTQDTPAVKSKTEDLSKIREEHQREKAAGRFVWLLSLTYALALTWMQLCTADGD